MANKQDVTRYKAFPEHDTPKNSKYQHSFSLPNPNVVRIEVLSPKARKYYLSTFFGTLEQLRTELVDQLMPIDANRPFYAIFDPQQTGDIGFDLRSNWEARGDSTFSGLAKIFEGVPGLGHIAGAAAKGAGIANKLLGKVGIDNSSTGTGTLKTFSKSDFSFQKNIKCSWYMPEMEAQARVSISRLLKLAFVRNFDEKNKGNYLEKISTALTKVAHSIRDESKKGYDEGEQQTQAENPGGSGSSGTVTGVVKQGVKAAGQWVGDGLGTLAEITGLGLDQLITYGMKMNEFFGGSLTFAPFPVRLTLGHILDIEPLVITNVHITGSKEQFMTDDGSNIPLFVNADIQFDTWMTPDPNKGFIRWLGDDVFNLGYSVGKSEKTPGGGGANPTGNGTDGKAQSSKKGKNAKGRGGAKAQPATKK